MRPLTPLYYFLLPFTSAYIIYTYTYTWAESDTNTTYLLFRYNAVFNGSLTLNMTSTDPSCAMADTIANYTLAIGAIAPRSNTSLSRASFDTNPYYFTLYGQASGNQSGGYLATESSRDMTENATAAESVLWTLTATRSGDGYDTAGTLATLSDWNTQKLNSTCEGSFDASIDPEAGWTMTGRITEGRVEMSWGPADWTEEGVSYTRRWRFEGSWNDNGAKLVLGGDKIETEGVWSDEKEAEEEKKGGAAKEMLGWRGVWIVVAVKTLEFRTQTSEIKHHPTHTSTPPTQPANMKRNIVIFLIVLILFFLIAAIAYLIYYLQTRMAVGGNSSSVTSMSEA
ncbi:hypothetical protein BDV95DRAFT_608369 [Massariosphaeria phaeospora]|uniref:Uncharacterized protein n=1 Tax=Massariosphaeria phaeospora TaxID=100035 RepID=A0A7C8I424_9PLEO|nr:hypothetical protein BDV95DRAFT_608369 [Massariosphaeria phaeospora]